MKACVQQRHALACGWHWEFNVLTQDVFFQELRLCCIRLVKSPINYY